MTWDEIYNLLKAQESPKIEIPKVIPIEPESLSIEKTIGTLIVDSKEPKN